MKLTALFTMLFLSLCSVASADMKQMFSTWLTRNRATTDDTKAMTSLLSELTKAHPDPNKRLNVFYDFAMGSNDPAMGQQARMTLAAIWPELAPPAVRARFLVSRIETASPSELRALGAYLERDIVKPSAVAAAKAGTLVEPHGCGRETLMSAEAYRTDNSILSARSVALLFELAPASVVLDLSDAGQSAEVVALVEAAEGARRRFDAADAGESIAAWENVQSVVRKMLELMNPALDGYVARIMAWRKNGPGLSNDPTILNTLKMRNDPVVNYLLAGKGVITLSEVGASETALFKSVAPEKPSPEDDGNSPDPAPQAGGRTPTESKAKPTVPTPSEQPTSSTPWSIIVVMIVAACGLLWLLLKRRTK